MNKYNEALIILNQQATLIESNLKFWTLEEAKQYLKSESDVATMFDEESQEHENIRNEQDAILNELF